jgi:hypothetical protein
MSPSEGIGTLAPKEGGGMKSFVVLSAILAAVLSVFFSALSRADAPAVEQFLAAAHAAGFTNNDDQLLRDGYAACALVSESGDDEPLVSRAIHAALQYLNRGVTQDQSDAFVALAVGTLCPEVVTTR